MKIRILDRILVAIAGLVLIALCVAIVGQVFFSKDVLGKAGSILADMGTTLKLVLIGVSAVLFLMGVYCVMMLFRHQKGRRGFVVQETENGDLAISLKALETMVLKCVDHHEEMELINCALESDKDTLIVKLKVSMAGGLNIPLSVSSLQKLVTQYVTACSGVEVREVKVVVENTGETLLTSPYVVPEIAAIQPALLKEKTEEEKPAVEERTHLFPEDDRPVTVELPPQEESQADTDDGEEVTEADIDEESDIDAEASEAVDQDTYAVETDAADEDVHAVTSDEEDAVAEDEEENKENE